MSRPSLVAPRCAYIASAFVSVPTVSVRPFEAADAAQIMCSVTDLPPGPTIPLVDQLMNAVSRAAREAEAPATTNRKKMAINTLGTTIADDLATNRRARLRLRLLFHTHDGQ